jgi:hypothetical protein
VVLTNQDLEAIASNLQIGYAGHHHRPASTGSPPRPCDRCERAVTAAGGTGGATGKASTPSAILRITRRFTSGKLDLEQWAQHKRDGQRGKTWLTVKLDKVSMYLYPGRDDLAVVTFDQTYASSNLENRMRKRLYWIREGQAVAHHQRRRFVSSSFAVPHAAP